MTRSHSCSRRERRRTTSLDVGSAAGGTGYHMTPRTGRRAQFAAEAPSPYRTSAPSSDSGAPGAASEPTEPGAPRATGESSEPGAPDATGSRPSRGSQDPRHAATTPEAGASSPVDSVLAGLRSVADEASRLDLDAYSDAQLQDYLTDLRRPLAMLEAARATLLATLESRAARRVAPGGSTRGARNEQRRRSADDQRIPPSRAKREAEAGHAAQQHDATGSAFATGEIGADHVRLIAELLTHVPPEQRDEVEGQLIALARAQEPVSFGRKARSLIHRIAPEQTAASERRKESRRELRVADTPDGSLVLSGRLHGTSAELVRVALDAFKRFDTPGSPRTAEQRNADAFLQLCEVALKAEQAPTRHGARPHVVVLVRAEDLDGEAGPARFGFSGQPVNLAQARRLFSDAVVSRIAFAADGALIEASAGVRNVPPALYRALVARDGGCTWDGCHAPPSWCEVAHGNVPFRANEPLRSGDAALLCRRHHSRFDHGPYRMVIEGQQVRYLRLAADGRPLGEPNPGVNGPALPGSPGRAATSGGSGASGTKHSPGSAERCAELHSGAEPHTQSAKDASLPRTYGGHPGWQGAGRRSGAPPPREAPNAPPSTVDGVPSPVEDEGAPAIEVEATRAEDQPSLFEDGHTDG